MLEKIKKYIDDLDLNDLQKKIIKAIIILIIIILLIKIFIPFVIKQTIEIKHDYDKKIIFNNSAIIQYRDKTSTIPITKISPKTIQIRDGDYLTNNIVYEINGIKIGANNYAYGPGSLGVGGFSTNTEYIINGTQVNINIGPNMNPNDDVIEGFMFYNFLDNGTILVYIYVDDDWKRKIKDTKIVWGKMNSWHNYTYFKKFDFQKIADGIYRDVIEDDKNRWFRNYTRSYGGIKVGNQDIYLGM
ncbi:MAG: hypothetical protein B6U87_00780 [Candidatus Aenigmarchaeota archaeon ex4484_52]|nr:MAG: hypothetical protein B6U87_00780 [Candidatus Aenigmarchaeota archaeon ex4484_52]